MNKQNFTLEEIEHQLILARKQNHSFFSIMSRCFKTVLEILALPALVYLVFAFILGIAQIEQSSMLPNFAEGDIVIFNRLEQNYTFGDVIIAQNLEDETLIIKRIIGTPGDTVEITENQQILVNGKPIRENWQSTGEISQGRAYLPITLADNEYFVLGDNRSVSIDSRNEEIGNIQKEHILGIVVYRFKMSK